MAQGLWPNLPTNISDCKTSEDKLKFVLKQSASYSYDTGLGTYAQAEDIYNRIINIFELED